MFEVERIPGRRGGFRARLALIECEGHGRYWEVYEGPHYLGTYNTPADVCRAFAGRVAEVYTYAAYEAACLKVMEADPEGWDTSDVVPVPVLAMVRELPEEDWGVHACATCGGRITYDRSSGLWQHMDAAEAADCADRRGDDPIRPEAYCNHDRAAVVDGVCECGAKIGA